MTPHQIEAATALGWPAQFETTIAGWCVFSGLGPVGRVNSCWPLDFDGSDLNAAIDAVEAFYRARNLPPQFKMIVGGATPSDLPARLATRGYNAHSHVAVMTTRQPLAPPEHDITIAPQVTPDMLALLHQTSLNPLDARERGEILARVPSPSAFGATYEDGVMTAMGLATFTGESAGIAAMRTLVNHRRQGLARSILRAVAKRAFEAGAKLLWLQVETDNVAATRLYESEGFETLYHYKTVHL